MIQKSLPVLGAEVLILGITFKENCPDIRNTRVIDVINELETFGVKLDIYDPWADRKEVQDEFQKTLISEVKGKYDAIVLTVAHSEFKALNLTKHLKAAGVVYDVKGVLEDDIVDARL